MKAALDFAPFFRPGMSLPAVRWPGGIKYDLNGGNNNPDRLPLDGIIVAAAKALGLTERSERIARTDEVFR